MLWPKIKWQIELSRPEQPGDYKLAIHLTDNSGGQEVLSGDVHVATHTPKRSALTHQHKQPPKLKQGHAKKRKTSGWSDFLAQLQALVKNLNKTLGLSLDLLQFLILCGVILGLPIPVALVRWANRRKRKRLEAESQQKDRKKKSQVAASKEPIATRSHDVKSTHQDTQSQHKQQKEAEAAPKRGAEAPPPEEQRWFGGEEEGQPETAAPIAPPPSEAGGAGSPISGIKSIPGSKSRSIQKDETFKMRPNEVKTPKWHLVSESLGVAYKLLEGTYKVGRDGDECDLILEQRSVSRYHFDLRVKGQQLFLTTLPNKNPIKLNGEIISGEVEITEPVYLLIGELEAAIEKRLA